MDNAIRARIETKSAEAKRFHGRREPCCLVESKRDLPAEKVLHKTEPNSILEKRRPDLGFVRGDDAVPLDVTIRFPRHNEAATCLPEHVETGRDDLCNPLWGAVTKEELHTLRKRLNVDSGYSTDIGLVRNCHFHRLITTCLHS